MGRARQRSVRADTTKYNAGTFPLNLYAIYADDDDTTSQPISFQSHKEALIEETEINKETEEETKDQN